MEETYRDDSGDDVKNEVIQYVGLVNVEAGIYGLSCSFRTPNKIFPDEASVEAFFKSVTPPDHLHPTEAWKKAKEIKVSENPADDDEETETE